MARELEIVVTMETAQAEQAAGRLDEGLHKVEQRAARTSDEIHKLERQVAEAANKKRVAADAEKFYADRMGETEKRLRDYEKAVESYERTGKRQAETAKTQAGSTDLLTQKIMQYAGPAVIVAAAKKTLDFADSIKTLSERTGASPKFIQQAGFAAEKAGSSFEGLADAMQTLDNNLVKSNKAATKALDDMGLSLDDLLAMNPEDRFIAIARAVSGIQDPAEKSATAMSLMGRSGKELIPLLDDLAKGAHETSFVMSNEMIGALAEMKKQLDSVMQFGKVFIGYFLGWPAMLGKWADDVAASIRKGFDNATRAASEWLVGGANRPALPNAPNNVGAFTGNQPLTFMGRPVVPQLGGAGIVQGGGLPTTGGAGGTGGGGGGYASGPDPIISALMQRAWWNNYSTYAYGQPLIGSLPGVGPGTFPGWAFMGGGFEGAIPGMLPGGLLASNPGIGAFQGVGFAPTVNPALGGGGGWWNNANSFLGGGSAWGALAGAGLGAAGGLLGSYLANNQNRAGQIGSGVGSTAGSIAGGIVGGPLGSWVGGVAGGWLGGRIGGAFHNPEIEVNDARDEFFAQFGDTRTEQVENLNREVSALGLSLDRLYRADDMHEFDAAVRQINNAFQEQEADTQRLQIAMQKYGISIQEMGAEFTQGEINKGAKEIMEDFRVLVQASGNFNMVAGKMAPTINSFINSAMEMGGTVPREMEPMLKKMFDMGLLTDAGGVKLDDFGKVKFADGPVEALTRVAEKLDKLIEGLFRTERAGEEGFGTLIGKVNEYGEAIERLPEVPVPDVGEGGWNPDYVHTGGLVAGRGRVLYMRYGGFVPRGSDTVPAMLTPGEMVLSRGMVRDIARAGASGARSSSVINLTVNIAHADDGERVGRDIVNHLQRRGKRMVA